MTGRKGYALRGSDAMTEAHQRGRYAGRDSGQERIVGRPAHSNKFIMRGSTIMTNARFMLSKFRVFAILFVIDSYTHYSTIPKAWKYRNFGRFSNVSDIGRQPGFFGKMVPVRQIQSLKTE